MVLSVTFIVYVGHNTTSCQIGVCFIDCVLYNRDSGDIFVLLMFVKFRRARYEKIMSRFQNKDSALFVVLYLGIFGFTHI